MLLGFHLKKIKLRYPFVFEMCISVFIVSLLGRGLPRDTFFKFRWNVS